ncbi:hypothetical protein LTR97_005767 [Elasticomyces elasticus]|uniref:Class I SAM-dependent methyltransferase n=1 Tax=Elasticomyces elasticus TaxID=574655 RepID=A0AAN8A2U6_9PEZI|nr:hypothetical protein LTR97_005767 [Elasticomyces elasticus]KAK5721705.1 hypothetical protein LTR15_006296 [Elasticomyces elasticus]
MAVLFPRFHLTEIEDTSWCPDWLRDHAHSSLARLWQVKSSDGNSLAIAACNVLLRVLGGIDNVAEYTIVDACSGAGGPTPFFEKYINKQLEASGHNPASFVLTDWAPYVERWQKLSEESPNISYISEPIDAADAKRIAAPGKKECRIFNLCFHHFDDPAAAKILRSAIEEADAFFIFEITHRTLPSITYTSLASAFGALSETWINHRWSPFHLIFTYLIPLFPFYYIFDGVVSCIRGRTAEETSALLKDQQKVDLSGWDIRNGEEMVLPPIGTLFWYSGVKKSS